MLTSGVIVFSCGKEIDKNQITEVKSIDFLAEKNKVTVEDKQDVSDLFKSLFIIKTPERAISAYTEEQKALNSKITIEGDNIYVKMPYNPALKLDEAGILTATITSSSAPGTSPATFDIPISIGANEFTHQKMITGVVKKLPKKIGDKDIEKEYSIHFKYDKDAAKSASDKCDLFPTDTTVDSPINNLSFTRNHQYKKLEETITANNSYVCENAEVNGKNHGKCNGLSKTSKAVTPVLTTALTSKNGDSEANAIEMHFEGGTLSHHFVSTTISNPEKSFDIGILAHDYDGDNPKFTMPNFEFIADGAVLPDGAFFSVEGVNGTDCDVKYKQKICPIIPNTGFKMYNPMPLVDNGIIFKVVAQNGINKKFYKLIFKNKNTRPRF
ncbi:hypothetical protein JBKA6_1449 [Ichthyobacterium seriolicida]|uniref:Uncharacterized protein n=2 Tax=Ichthyobacterium seriolicida TaxID=242600 RepID=A0A1J1E7Z7_9FLAO|nr:hypothetical protein JBKA6_1449 [Ichthyobacterium seriolicida]